jgi:hypothetical protein
MADKSDGPTQGPLETGSLLEAILAVQAQAPKLFKTKTARVKTKTGGEYSYSYADLGVIVDQVGPMMAEQGLVFQAFPTLDAQGRPALRYKLSHAPSKESDEDTMPLILPQSDMQGVGSALTYSRRYALCSVMNLVADEDDDGQAAKAQTAGDLARAKSRMGDEEKALMSEAQQLYATWTGEGKITEAQFKAYQDSTGYTAEGLQRLVNWLKERA